MDRLGPRLVPGFDDYLYLRQARYNFDEDNGCKYNSQMNTVNQKTKILSFNTLMLHSHERTVDDMYITY